MPIADTAMKPTPAFPAHATVPAQRWLLAAAALLAVWMLTFFVQLLNESIHRGEAMRQQQRTDVQTAFGHADALRTASKNNVMLTAAR